MRKQTKLVAVLSAAALLAIGASMTSFAKGWTEENGEWVWLDSDGERVYNEWKKSGENYYWLDENGVMATNKLVDDDEENIYYVNENGVRVKNAWISLENENDDVVNNANSDAEIPDTLWYFFGSNGKAYRCSDTSKEWTKKSVDYAGGTGYFFFNSEGQMGSGWINYDGNTYYCGDENQGYAHTWWQYLEPNDDMQSGDYDDQEWFYFGSKGGNGKMAKGETKYIDKRYYTFDENGVLEDDWYVDEIATAGTASAGGADVWAYSNESGSLGSGWVFTSKYNDSDTEKWYYLVNIKIDGLRRSVPFNSLVDDTTGDAGYRAKSIKGKTYLFDKTGVMFTGLADDELEFGTVDYEVYADLTDNANQAGSWNGIPTKVLKPGVYYFKEGGYTSTAGQMQTGRVTYSKDGDESYFYFDKDGAAITCQVKDGVVYGWDGKRIQAEDGNSNEPMTLSYDLEYSKGKDLLYTEADGTKVYGIEAGHKFIVSSTGKLRTSGKVTIEGIKYTIEKGVVTNEDVVD